MQSAKLGSQKAVPEQMLLKMRYTNTLYFSRFVFNNVCIHFKKVKLFPAIETE